MCSGWDSVWQYLALVGGTVVISATLTGMLSWWFDA